MGKILLFFNINTYLLSLLVYSSITLHTFMCLIYFWMIYEFVIYYKTIPGSRTIIPTVVTLMKPTIYDTIFMPLNLSTKIIIHVKAKYTLFAGKHLLIKYKQIKYFYIKINRMNCSRNSLIII